MEMYNNTIIDGVLVDTHENYLRANVWGKSTKITVKINNTSHLYPIPGKFPAKTCINPKLTIEVDPFDTIESYFNTK